MTRRDEWILAAALGIALTVLAYGYAVHVPLLWDDMDVVTPAGVRLTTADIPSFFGAAHWVTHANSHPRPYRPVRDTAIALAGDAAVLADHALGRAGGRSLAEEDWRSVALADRVAWGTHLANLILQAINCFLVFLLAKRLMPGRLGPFVALALFALHPIHMEAMLWVKNTAELLALLLVLLSALCFMRAATGGGRGGWAASVLFYAMAVLCKEAALPLPGILMLWALLWLEGRERRAALWMTLPLWTVGMACAVSQMGFVKGDGIDRAGVGPTSPAGRLLVAGRSLVLYAGMLLFGIRYVPLCEWFHMPEAGALEGLLLAAAFGLTGLIFLVCIVRRHRISFGLWWILMALGPVANMVGFSSARPVAQQRLYVPSVGLALFAGALLTRLKGARRRMALAAVVLLCLSWGALTLDAGPHWLAKLPFWRWAVRASPTRSMPHYNCGIMYAQAAAKARADGKPDLALMHERMAEAIYLHAHRIQPANPDISYNLGNTFRRRERYAEAARSHREALRALPAHAKARWGLGMSLLSLGRKEEAAREIDLARRLDRAVQRDAAPVLAQLFADLKRPDDALTEARSALKFHGGDARLRFLAARLLKEKGQYAEALEHQAEAVEAGLREPRHYYLLGELNRVLGKLREAEEAFLAALRGAPDHVDAHGRLGLVQLRLGKFAQAAPHFERVLKEHPDNLDACYGLAGIRLQQKRWGEAAPLYEKALKQQPERIGVLVNFARVLVFGKIDAERGLGLIEKARGLRPKDAFILSVQADCFEAVGRRDDAVKALREAVRLVPGNAALQGKLKRLLDADKANDTPR